MASRMINPQPYVPPSTIAVQAEMWRVGSGGSAVSYKHGVLRGWDRDAAGIPTYEIMVRARPDTVIIGASLVACVSDGPASPNGHRRDVSIFPRDSEVGEVITTFRSL